MPIAVFFQDASARAVYDKATELIKADASWKPEGLIFHAAYATDEGVKVFEVWDNAEQLHAFGEAIGPLLQEVGAPDAPPPFVYEVVNLEA